MTMDLLTHLPCEGEVVLRPLVGSLQEGCQIELLQVGSRRFRDRNDNALAMTTAQQITT
jgi:hypothetical protein